jgi:thymidylate kinase
MANLIILEGTSRTGKTSIAKILQDEGYRSLSIKNKLPDSIQNHHDFYHGIHILSNEVFKAFPEETFILDRSFLSEIIYSRFFDRLTHIYKDEVIHDLLYNNNFLLVLLDSTYQDYLDRKPKDRIVYTEQDFIQHKDLFHWHFHNYRDSNECPLWRSRFLNIDTSTTNLTETVNRIKSKVNIR